MNSGGRGYRLGILGGGAFGSGDSIAYQHGHCHRPNPARHRRDMRRLLAYACEIDIAGEPSIGQTVDADVNDDGAALDHGRGDEAGASGGDDQDVRKYRVLREVAGLDMTD